MPLIKSANAPTSISGFSLRDVEVQAASLLAKAQRQASEMLAQAALRAQSMADDAREKGFEQGVAEGLKTGHEQGLAKGEGDALAEHRDKLTELTNTCTTMVDQLQVSRAEMEAAALTSVIQLAVAIARRTTKLQGTLDPAVLTENIKQAVRLVAQRSAVSIYIHPSQRAALNDLLPQLKQAWPQVEQVKLLDDESIAPGGCRVQAGQCVIDADLDRQIDRIAADLLPGAEQ